MKTINLNGVTNTLSENEMKHVVGGLDNIMIDLDLPMGGAAPIKSCGSAAAGTDYCKDSAVGRRCWVSNTSWGTCQLHSDVIHGHCLICDLRIK